ncbi:MAG: hypothetical protein EOP09_07675 [Proteobacteria bacterium]|nr:MAG: hypothetical protein EOP09_07675 [Pseudomonadota bacterium]
MILGTAGAMFKGRILTSLFSILGLLSVVSFARFETPDDSDLLYYAGRRLGSTPEQQVREADKILKQVKARIETRNVKTETVQLSDQQGRVYRALKIVPGASSPLNQEAERVSQSLFNIPLLFSPYDLSRGGSSAFFDPNGSKIGVSYAFILGNVQHESYRHELMHAETFARVMRKQTDLYAGVLKLLQGEAMSTRNRRSYFRFASLDEMVTTSYSLSLTAQVVGDLMKSTTREQFMSSRGQAQALGDEMSHSIEMGLGLAKQVIDITTQALEQPWSISSLELKLGTGSSKHYRSVSLVNSYQREFENGRGFDRPLPKGTELTLYWSERPTDAQITARLTRLKTLAEDTERQLKAANDCLSIMIERIDVERTDWNCLLARAPTAFQTLKPWSP